ncbi:MAG TPA: universal stress protein [Thermoanaerobaculia bacterium]|nr:universal stress protein [Thermoanaerobaculia bacterium]
MIVLLLAVAAVLVLNALIGFTIVREDRVVDGRGERETRHPPGEPNREILEAIHEHKADLVVMGSHGITRRIPIGSKAEYVLRHTDTLVLLIRDAQ